MLFSGGWCLLHVLRPRGLGLIQSRCRRAATILPSWTIPLLLLTTKRSPARSLGRYRLDAASGLSKSGRDWVTTELPYFGTFVAINSNVPKFLLESYSPGEAHVSDPTTYFSIFALNSTAGAWSIESSFSLYGAVRSVAFTGDELLIGATLYTWHDDSKAWSSETLFSGSVSPPGLTANRAVLDTRIGSRTAHVYVYSHNFSASQPWTLDASFEFSNADVSTWDVRHAGAVVMAAPNLNYDPPQELRIFEEIAPRQWQPVATIREPIDYTETLQLDPVSGELASFADGTGPAWALQRKSGAWVWTEIEDSMNRGGGPTACSGHRIVVQDNANWGNTLHVYEGLFCFLAADVV